MLFFPKIIGFGPKQTEKVYTFDFPEGQGKVNTKMIIQYGTLSLFGPQFASSYVFWIDMTSNGIVSIQYFSYISFSLYFNNKHISAPVADTNKYNLSSWGTGGSLPLLYKGDNCSIEGVAISKFKSDNTIYNETVNFNLNIIINISSIDYQSIFYGIIILQFIYFISLIILFFRALRILRFRKNEQIGDLTENQFKIIKLSSQ